MYDPEDVKASCEAKLIDGLNQARIYNGTVRSQKRFSRLPIVGEKAKMFRAAMRVELLLFRLISASRENKCLLTDKLLGGSGENNFAKTLSEINSYLRQLPFCHVLNGYAKPSTLWEENPSSPSGDDWEVCAVDLVLWLLKIQELSRLKLCQCEKWFYAVRSLQRYCSTACRQKAHSQSPEFKEAKKDYMRKHRKAAKEREEKERKLAGIVLGKRSALKNKDHG